MRIKQRKRVSKPLKILPLLECVMIEITDPAEKAALDRRCRDAEKAMAGDPPNAKKSRPRKKKN